MSIFSRALVTVLVCVPIAVAAACSASGTCLRNSDCNEGLTCLGALCVVPPAPPSDGGAAPATNDTSDGGAPSGDDAAPAVDARSTVDADAQGADVSTDDVIVPAVDASGE
jgi:hypothetical protein